ncbi:Tyrocidine synthase 3 [Botrimarina colliarenosi]|uniref:Tyrocidine synthase 3 n=1 Tax=Botrimarina colliarenosi TaxID=2528001 RepID=A0A5C6AJX3_9BACT|nr:AMP-binding protein [Botrimarina colliarenosi]TWT99321.1 Tyrocidine synthase 3 [Botrimarina colliarenosi]
MDAPAQDRVNVADRLAEAARERPDAVALATPAKGDGWRTVSLGDLDRDATQLAHGLAALGVGPGRRIALLVKPGVEFVALVFALLRTGATMVLVDAGLGRKNIVRCLASTNPDGFVAIPLGHALRVLKRKQFANAKLNVTVGRRWFWGGETLASVRRLGGVTTPPTGVRGSTPNDSAIRNPQSAIAHTTASDPAAIVFTSGSTGPPKGVLYTHETFVTQCAMIQQEYDIRPGDIDLACFPLFGLFNVACGVTVVLPDMDFSRPASCDPKKLLAAANHWKVTQAFASPAVWERVSQHCETTGESIPTLRKILSCGAPVPAKVLRRTLACVHPEATMHTPYGATEALPIATIEAQEILGATAAKTDAGAGVCVGRKFKGIADYGLRIAESSDGEPSTSVGGGTSNWRIIRITDAPIASIDDTEELPQGEIGELIVRGPQVSQRYLEAEPRPSGSDQQRPTHNEIAKIADGDTIWHRIGDVGYFDEQERFWYCGRKSQRVVTSEGTLYTECVENVFNVQPMVHRTALVGLGSRGSQLPVVVYVRVNLKRVLGRSGHPSLEELANALLVGLADVHAERFADQAGKMKFLQRKSLPTDIRHNSKIRREELAVWAAKQLRKRR